MKKKIIIFLIILLALFGISSSAFYFIRLADKKQEKSTNDKITILQKQISRLSEKLNQIEKSDSGQAALPSEEVVKREEIRAKSQDELLTSAVAKVAPSVVSIVITKDVPQLEITYVNPFGDDPFFKDFGFQVPVYRQKGTQKQKVGAGTGFFISQDGYILTNKHVVFEENASYTVLLADGGQKEARVMYKDPQMDVAIIKVEGKNYKAVSLGNSSQLKLGQNVIAIGNALGEYNNSISVGIISGLNRSLEAAGSSGAEQLSGVIQTDAAINPGNSGGPLIDLNGNVIGVNVATTRNASNISFSIPIDTAKQIIKTVLNNR